jgi:alpha-beta hydrolase superfamily lysophospholipase
LLNLSEQAALEYITQHPVLGKTPLIAYGQSIGGAVAIYTVSRNEDKFSGLILENTFLNLVSVEIANGLITSQLLKTNLFVAGTDSACHPCLEALYFPMPSNLAIES